MTEQRGYQHDYSAINPEMYSAENRERKAATVLSILTEAMGRTNLLNSDLLNIGCSTGIIDSLIAPHVRSALGTDIDQEAIRFATASHDQSNLRFIVEDAMSLSFPKSSFDVVICSQVYEHVPDAKRLMSELHRVLRPGGLCYFAATNRWALTERHYHLPFLSWLPQSAANAYLRLARKGDIYYEKHLGYFALRRLASDFEIEDVTPRLLADPDRYQASYMFPTAISRILARGVYHAARPVFPGFIWLLWKGR